MPTTLTPDDSAVWVSGDGVGSNYTVNTGELCCWPRVLGPSSLFIYKLLPTMEDPTPIPETLVPRLEGHGIVSEVFVW